MKSKYVCVCLCLSEQISKRQSQIDRLYVSLKDLVEERKSRLEQQYWLFQLHREVDELEQWIAEREVIASSTELGQDFEHVTVSFTLLHQLFRIYQINCSSSVS